MTTRPPAASQTLWQMSRTYRPCNLLEVTRLDGFVLCFTDHDRAIKFEGQTYTPFFMAGMSADRREAALRSGNQEVYGVVDGTTITVPDLMGNLYRGAEVKHVVTDWKYPWLWYARHRKWIRNVNHTRVGFTGTLESRSQQLHRPNAGRFGGMHSIPCTYKLGGQYCKKDISAWNVLGAKVDSVVDRFSVAFNTTQWAAGHQQVDNFYRNGEIEWVWADKVEQHDTYTPVTSTVLTDPLRSWVPDEHVGRYVRLIYASPNYVVEWAIITGNDATHLYYDEGMINAYPAATYDICPLSRNHGHVSPILKYAAATRTITMLRHTPYPVLAGDSGIVRVGCDGSWKACTDIFGNGDNHGGNPLEPSAAKVVEPAKS